MHIILYWVIALFLTLLLHNTSFLIIKHSFNREELSDAVFFLQTELQHITVQKNLFGEFALTPVPLFRAPPQLTISLHLALNVCVYSYQKSPQLHPHLRGRKFSTLSTPYQPHR